MRTVAPLRRVTAATYQAVTGAGAAAAAELDAQLAAHGRGEDLPAPEQFPHQIALNVLPHVDAFEEDGYTREELKMRNETRKILHLPGPAVLVHLRTYSDHDRARRGGARRVLRQGAHRRVARRPRGPRGHRAEVDDPAAAVYPTPLNTAGDDRTFVGRLRADPSVEHGAVFWCVTDNLRKGAATNAIQIAEELIRRGKL